MKLMLLWVLLLFGSGAKGRKFFELEPQYLLIKEKLTQSEARERCGEVGMDLAIVTSEEEQQAIDEFLGLSKKDKSKKIWIGLERSECDDSQWTWVDDCHLDQDYLPWETSSESHSHEKAPKKKGSKENGSEGGNDEKGYKRSSEKKNPKKGKNSHSDSSESGSKEKDNCVIMKKGEWKPRRCDKKEWALCEKKELNHWCQPFGWTLGQPVYYFPFENSERSTLTDEDQIGPGHIGNAVSSSKIPIRSIDINGLTEACVLQPGSCTGTGGGSAGGSLSTWVRVDEHCSVSQYHPEGFISSQDRLPFSEGIRVRCGVESGVELLTYHLYLDNKEYKVSTPRPPIDEWFHLVYVFESNSVGFSVYINGAFAVQSGSGLSKTLVLGQKNLALGRSFVNYYTYRDGDFSFDEMTLWNEPLTAEQVSDIYQNDVDAIECQAPVAELV